MLEDAQAYPLSRSPSGPYFSASASATGSVNFLCHCFFLGPVGLYLSVCILGILPWSPHRPPPLASFWCFLVPNPPDLVLWGASVLLVAVLSADGASILCDQKAIAEIMSHVHQILYYSLPGQTGILLKGITLS